MKRAASRGILVTEAIESLEVAARTRSEASIPERLPVVERAEGFLPYNSVIAHTSQPIRDNLTPSNVSNHY